MLITDLLRFFVFFNISYVAFPEAISEAIPKAIPIEESSKTLFFNFVNTCHCYCYFFLFYSRS